MTWIPIPQLTKKLLQVEADNYVQSIAHLPPYQQSLLVTLRWEAHKRQEQIHRHAALALTRSYNALLSESPPAKQSR